MPDSLRRRINLKTSQLNISSHYLVMALCILIIPFAQILLKLGSKNEQNSSIGLFNPMLCTGLFLLFAVSILSVYSFQVVPLKTSSAWTSLSFIGVALGSHYILKEHFPISRVLGCSFIIAGILIFHL